MSLKRILKELHDIIPNQLLKFKINNLYSFSEIGNDIICDQIAVINKINNNLELKIKIPKDYPFKPPNVTIYLTNNYYESYSSWLSKIINYKDYNKNKLDEKNYNAWIFSIILWPQFKSMLKYPKNGFCYCCNTILCNDTWSPSFTFVNILIEYLMIKQFQIFSSNLNQKQIKNIFNNDKWVLPNDIINNIIKFL